MGFSVKQGEELVYVPQFLQKLRELANRAGGDPPKPLPPETATLDEIQLATGNEQLIALYNKREDLAESIETWSDLACRIEKKWPVWITLKRLIGHTKGLKDAEVLVSQVKQIEDKRLLLEEQHLIEPLPANVTQILRDELNRLDKEYRLNHDKGMLRLKEDTNWRQLSPEQRNTLLAEQKLTLADAPTIKVSDTNEVLATLDKMSLSALADRVAALSSRFDAILVAAAELMEPEAQFLQIPKRMLKTEEDIEMWLQEIRERFKKALPKGPIIIQ